MVALLDSVGVKHTLVLADHGLGSSSAYASGRLPRDTEEREPAARPDNGWLQRCQEAGALIAHPVKVSSYLSAHPDMGPVLCDLMDATRSAFGPAVELSVVFWEDLDIDDRHLKLMVRRAKYTEEDFLLIRNLRRQFADRLSPLSGYLHLTTDLGYPAT